MITAASRYCYMTTLNNRWFDSVSLRTLRRFARRYIFSVQRTVNQSVWCQEVWVSFLTEQAGFFLCSLLHCRTPQTTWQVLLFRSILRYIQELPLPSDRSHTDYSWTPVIRMLLQPCLLISVALVVLWFRQNWKMSWNASPRLYWTHIDDRMSGLCRRTTNAPLLRISLHHQRLSAHNLTAWPTNQRFLFHRRISFGQTSFSYTHSRFRNGCGWFQPCSKMLLVSWTDSVFLRAVLMYLSPLPQWFPCPFSDNIW